MSTPQSSAKYAVIRLKRTDDVLELFHLLISNGFGEVSFVNALNETIFPTQNRTDKTTQTPQETYQQQHQDISLTQQYHQHPAISLNQIIRSAATQNSSTSSDVKSNDADTTTRRTETDEQLLRLNLLHCGGTMATLPTIPSTYLGLSTLPSILAAVGQNAYSSSMSMFHDGMPLSDATPPYSISLTSGRGLFASPIPSVIPAQISLPMQNRPMSTSTGHFSIAGVGQHRKQEVLGGTSPVMTASSSSSENFYNSALLSGSATTQLRQRGQRACIADDPSLYVVCRMCKNKIMGSRISNLTNHVRRHSTMKQFQCCYCDYTHNEMAKVRLHMLHNHKDKDSQPIDNVSPEMQVAWDILMKECFPEQFQSNSNQANIGRVRRSWKQSGGPSSDRSSESGSFSGTAMDLGSPADHAAFVEKQADESKASITKIGCGKESSLTVLQYDGVHASRMIQNYADYKSLESFVRCIECGQTVNVQRRLHHIQKYHVRCLPFSCSLCSYGAVDQAKVILHIAVKHKDDHTGRIIKRNVDSMVQYLLPTYFIADTNAQQAGARRTTSDCISAISLSPSESPSEVEVRTPIPAEGLQLPIKNLKHEPNEIYASKTSMRDALTVWSNHLKRTERKKYRCHLCLKNVAGIQSVIRHSKRHAKIKWYRCVSCSYTSCNYKRVCRHLIRRHNITDGTPRLHSIWKIKRPWKSFVQQCFFNPLRVVPKRNEKRTVRDLQKSKVEYCGSVVQSAKENLMKNENSTRSCNLCGSNVSFDNLTEHVRFHVPYSVYGCSICAFLTSNAIQARVHLWKHWKLKMNSKSRKSAKLLNGTAYAKAHFELCFG